MMRIVTLVENSAGAEGCIAEHGLSLYIETAKHKLLLDAGQSDAVIKNAKTLGIDLTDVDRLFLSHGHYDHSGGIIAFHEMNPTASIIMHRRAPERHYNHRKFIGIDPRILEIENLRLIDGNMRIDNELFLFSGVTGKKYVPEGNKRLLMYQGTKKVPDDFAHEIYLVVSCEGKNILISGCAHNGIVNIVERYEEIFGSYPDIVISGFHLRKKHWPYRARDLKTITDTAKALLKTGSLYFTGHCTGEPAFEIMKEIMGDKLFHLHSGEELPL